MKTITTALWLLLAAYAAAQNAGTPPTPAGTTPARYQLTTSNIVLVSGTQVPAVFRVDTATGITWILQSMPHSPGDNRGFPTWVPVHEVDSPTYMSLINQLRALQK
jgi:hypothetical protein